MTIHAQIDEETFLKLTWQHDRSLLLACMTPASTPHGPKWQSVNLGVVKADVLDRFLLVRPAKEKGGLKVCRATVH